jgi:hypothetical protein
MVKIDRPYELVPAGDGWVPDPDGQVRTAMWEPEYPQLELI